MNMKRCLNLVLLSGWLAIIPAVVGAIDISLREYDLPTPNSRPHDPAVGPDRSLWYTGQQANVLGRLDPGTGKIKEYRLKTPDSGPHGIVADAKGNIWFTANYKGYVGKLNPDTGEITEYPMPDPRAKDPHSLVLDRSGILWLTFEQSNFIGRLDPATGDVKLAQSPTPHSLPYGIVATSTGTPFYCEFGANKIGSVDPGTMMITEYKLPEGARPRRLTVGPGDVIYYSDYARGRLGRLDPSTRKVSEWKSPGGPESKPYGIATGADGAVWYSESGVRPNTIVRFDPTTKTFSHWPIPSGGGVVRNMAATPSGDLYIACSGVNKVGILRMGK